MAANKPYLPNLEPLIAAGINPKTGLPAKLGDVDAHIKTDIKHFLRLIDEQDAVNRYVWYNLPCDLTSQELERMLYYKGQLCFFYNEQLNQFFFMPYALNGTIDFYGRYNHIHPIPMTSGNTESEKADYGRQLAYLSTLDLKCVYGIKPLENLTYEDFTNSTVLLHDYSKQMAQSIIPRVNVNDGLIDIMAECIPMMRTNLISGSGVEGIRVQDADQSSSVAIANAGIENAAITGKKYIPIVGAIEFQELTDGNLTDAEQYMLAMKSLDNLRLSGYGIDNGGLFEKKAHELQTEADLNGGPVGLVLQDGLQIRQNFCNIVNSIWGLGIWCEVNENISNLDRNGDGALYTTNEDQTHSGIDQGGTNNESNNEI